MNEAGIARRFKVEIRIDLLGLVEMAGNARL